ncbi:MAG: Calx-beta domain-containing protein [Vicinamibacterales bacterium]
MLSVKMVALIGLVAALLATSACGDSSKALNPTAPSATAVSTQSEVAALAGAESGAAARGGNPGKPENPGNGNGNDKGPRTSEPPAGPSPGAPAAPGNPGSSKVEIEGLISAIAGTAITVNSRPINVPVDAVIRHGQRAVAFSELSLGDRVHVRARMQASLLEATEVKLQNPGGGDDDGDDDGEPEGGTVWVSIVDAMAAETGADPGAFRLTRIANAALPLTSPLTVTFALTGTATNGTDYTNVPLAATFLAGQSTVDVAVAPIADALAEGSETVILALTSVAPYTLGLPTSGTVTISDAAPVVSVAAFDATAGETGPDLGTFRFSRAGALTSSLTVVYTVTGTAVNGTDYQAIPVTVTFLAGQATADVFVIPAADGLDEALETAIVTLTDGATYDLGVLATATITITD